MVFPGHVIYTRYLILGLLRGGEIDLILIFASSEENLVPVF